MFAEMRGNLAPGKRKAYALAGNATLTVENPKSGNRFTYQLRQSEPKPGQMPVWFVALLTGPNNERDWRYLGTIFADGFRLTRKSCAGRDAPSVVAFQWFSVRWEDARVSVWHEGACGRCGRKLTVPESIASGIGPVCAGK